MAITRHQRVFGYVWHWQTGPAWVRDVSALRRLRQAGMFGLKVQLHDDGEIPREYANMVRSVGLSFDGMTWLTSSSTPEALKAERVRLALSGLDLNGEDAVLALDVASNGQWSHNFATRLRQICPTLPLTFDSYWGPIGAGINVGAWKAIGPFYVQTFWTESGDIDGLWNDPTTNIVRKGAGAQPVLPRSILKPIFRVAPNNAGQLPNWDVVFTDTKIAGTKGCGLYYIDGAPSLDYVCDLTRRAISSGAAY